MNILITGANGLIGRALIASMLGSGHRIICQSRRCQKVEPELEWVKHDLVDDSWDDLGLPEIDIVYHLAAQTSTYAARQDPIADLSVNVIGLLKLLEFIRAREMSTFVVLAGTATEVGLSDLLPINERTPDDPITFYDIGKLTAERYLKQYVREGFVKGCSLRLCNVYGRCQAGQRKDRGVLDKIYQQAISGQDITVYGDGNYLRDYIFIDDVVSALIAASESMEQTNGRAFYIGSGQSVKLIDAFLKVISLAERVTGRKVQYKHVQPPPELSDIEFRNAVVDTSAFRSATGWIPQYDLDAGLEEAYQR